jgi:hypothetical protein
MECVLACLALVLALGGHILPALLSCSLSLRLSHFLSLSHSDSPTFFHSLTYTIQQQWFFPTTC